MTRRDAIDFLIQTPYLFGHLLGFKKLKKLHNEWIRDMVLGINDETLQAHRGSYKTTCVSIALALIIILYPQKRTLFLRKTDEDVKEIIRQVQNILKDPHTLQLVKVIYGVDLRLTKESATEIKTNLCNDIRGTAQLVGAGIGSSLTGKHYDFVFTDDIVNRKDRKSRAEREETKSSYQELQNIVTRPGKIFNTGTPWHADDAFCIMPAPKKYDCYHTGLMSEEEIQAKIESMTKALFAANYELRHVAEDDVLFIRPNLGAPPEMVINGESHVDAAYMGEDYTAFTICRKVDGKYYILGKLWRRHVDDVEPEIIDLHNRYNCGRLHCETNGDKGYLAKDLKKQGLRVHSYHEDTNKYFKISTYLKAEWKNVYFCEGTDEEYINQICDYNENAEHDDAPDSAACMIRAFWNKANSDRNKDFVPLW